MSFIAKFPFAACIHYTWTFCNAKYVDKYINLAFDRQTVVSFFNCQLLNCRLSCLVHHSAGFARRNRAPSSWRFRNVCIQKRFTRVLSNLSVRSADWSIYRRSNRQSENWIRYMEIRTCVYRSVVHGKCDIATRDVDSQSWNSINGKYWKNTIYRGNLVGVVFYRDTLLLSSKFFVISLANAKLMDRYNIRKRDRNNETLNTFVYTYNVRIQPIPYTKLP